MRHFKKIVLNLFISKSPEGNIPLGPLNLRKTVVSVLGLKLKTTVAVKSMPSVSGTIHHSFHLKISMALAGWFSVLEHHLVHYKGRFKKFKWPS